MTIQPRHTRDSAPGESNCVFAKRRAERLKAEKIARAAAAQSKLKNQPK